MSKTLIQCHETMAEIEEALAAVAKHIAEIDTEIAQLEADGVFNQEPSESWETRGGSDAKYLRLVFPSVQGERHKEYIGCNPVKITAAKAKIARTRRFHTLHTERAFVHRRMRAAFGSLTSAKSELQTSLRPDRPGGSRW